MSATEDGSKHADPSIDWTIFTPALLLIVAIGAGMIAWPETGAEFADAAMNFVTGKLGWLYLAIGVCSLFFASWLAFGPYGNVTLGTPGEVPEYSDLHWIAMMFTA